MNEPGSARDRIDAEHRVLARLLRQAEAAPDAGRLRPLLAELDPLLTRHFASEESDDGLHAAVRTLAPRHIPHVDAVLAEHEELLTTLRAIADGLGEADWSQSHAAVVAFVRRMRAHEARETDLFDDSVLGDVGAGD